MTAEKNADGKEERANFEAPRRSWSTFARRTPKIKSASAPDNKIAAAAAVTDAEATTSPEAVTAPEPPSSSSAGSSPQTATSLSTTSASFPSGSSLSSSAIPVTTPSSLASSASTPGLPLYLSSSSLLGSASKQEQPAAVERRSSGLKWFQRKTPPAAAAPAADNSKPLSPRGDSDKKDHQQQEKKDSSSSGPLETICPVSYADLKRQLDMLKRENNRLRFENSHLFKELDIVHRQLSLKLKPPTPKLNKQNSSLDILSSQTAYSYNIDTGLSYNLPLDEFLEQYYKDYPESLADLTIYQRKGKLASFSMRNGGDGVEEDERSKIKANLESALISQEDGKFTQGEGQTPRHESFIPTIVKRQFARDVPSMIRINGKIVNGRTDNEKVLIAYRILHDGLAGNDKLVNLVMSLANQNLGIFMYEKLVKHYTQIGMIVKQSWHHYLDITLSRVKINKYTNNKNVINELVDEYLRKERAAASTSASTSQPSRQKYEEGVVYLSEEESSSDHEVSSTRRRTRSRGKVGRGGRRRASRADLAPAEAAESPSMMDEDKAKLVEGIGIYMLAIFELQNTDLDGAPLFIKGMMEISFRNSPDGGAVHVLYSTPAFDVLSFVHSIDLDASLGDSGTESEGSDDDDDGDEATSNAEAKRQEERRLRHSTDDEQGKKEGQEAKAKAKTTEAAHEQKHQEGNTQLGSDDVPVVVEGENEAKMKEAHGDADADRLPTTATTTAASAYQEKPEPPKESSTACQQIEQPPERPQDMSDASTAVAADDEDEKVVVQKGRRRRVLSMRDLTLAGIPAPAKADSTSTSPRGEEAAADTRERARSLGRREDEEWFRRMEEEVAGQTSPRGSTTGTGKEN